MLVSWIKSSESEIRRFVIVVKSVAIKFAPTKQKMAHGQWRATAISRSLPKQGATGGLQILSKPDAPVKKSERWEYRNWGVQK